MALSGAHTLGGKGFGDPVTFDNTYFRTLLDKCAGGLGEERAASLLSQGCVR